MAIVYISALVSVSIIVFIWVLIRSRYTPPKLKEARLLSKKYYTKKFFFRNKEIGIYDFLDTCFDRFTSTPDKLYRYKDGYYALWRHYGSGAITGHDKYTTVLIISTNHKKLYGHVRSPRALENKKNFVFIGNNYYHCGFDSNELYINEFYFSVLSEITENYSDSGWNFVFARGWLAIYYNGFSFDEKKLEKLYDSFKFNRSGLATRGRSGAKDLSNRQKQP